MEISYKLFENGLDFVLSSANQLRLLTAESEEREKKRLLKYSLLHLFSGIELIIKYRLLAEHWTYVYADMNKADKKKFSGGDFQSASSNDLFVRLSTLCDIEVKQHQKAEVSKLQELRNKAMHFEVSENINAIKSRINKNITFIISFISEHITINTVSDEERHLIGEIKTVLRELTEHYNNALLLAKKVAKEKGIYECLEICEACEEVFLWKNDGCAECIFCGEKYSGEDLAKRYLYEQGFCEYSAVTSGGEFPCYDCPECGSHSFVIIHDHNFAKCFTCQEEYPASEVTFCSGCGEPVIDTSGRGGELCSSCLDYLWSKNI